MSSASTEERILVTDGEIRSVVGASRGLAAEGFRVGAVAATRPAATHWSRSCRDRFQLPYPLEDPDAFVDGIVRIVSSAAHAALVPGSDGSLFILSRERARTEPHVPMGLPPHEAVVASLSKLSLAGAAAETGLAAPETAVCQSVDDALSAASRMGYPVLLKPVSSLIELAGVPLRVGSIRVDDPERLADQAPGYGTPCLIERAEVGELISFAGVLAEGRLLATAVSRYVRTWYPEGGNVCFSETIEVPAGLAERVVALLESLGWQGIFELELIRRPDGSYAAIDLNPRLYGSIALAIAAGADVPAIWCEWLLGRARPPATARPGVNYRWEDADLRHALKLARRGQPAKAAAVLRPRRGTTHPYFSRSDPGPLVARAIELMGLLRKRAAPAPASEPDVRAHRLPFSRRKPGEVAVIGAGPYGLATAAHLRHAGVPVRVFGEVLEFWRTQMPEGMLLRSRKRSTHIADPERRLTIDDYEADTGRTVTTPSLTLTEFIEYGQWFQEKAVPDVDRRKVRTLERSDGSFRLELEDGEEVRVDRAVVAAGLFPFGRRPEPFRSLPPELVSHSADVRDLSRFAERKVLVVGGGQSALESAALLHEAGAEVEVAIRQPEIVWLGPPPGAPHRPGIRSRLPLPPTDVGGFATGWTAALPDVWRLVPRPLKPVVSYRCIRPAGSGWLRPRLEGVPLGTQSVAVGAHASNGGVRVDLADGRERQFDHVLLGTGYEIDVRSYPFLSPELAAQIDVEGGYPRLRAGLESSVPGLHFVGAPGALTFGPIMRFVVGTWYAAPSLTGQVLGRWQRPLRTAF